MVPKPSAWQAIPAWAMAAAAAVILAVGGAGGAVMHALLPAAGAAPSAPARAAVQAPVSQDASVTIAALEQRVRELEKSNATMGELVRALSSRPSPAPEATQVNVNAADLTNQIRALTERQDELSRTMLSMRMETVGLKNRQVGLQQLVSLSLDQNAGGR
jgi:hypothetical protein